MFVPRTAARRRMRRRRLIRELVAYRDRLFTNMILYGTSHPEALIDYTSTHGEADVRA